MKSSVHGDDGEYDDDIKKCKKDLVVSILCCIFVIQKEINNMKSAFYFILTVIVGLITLNRGILTVVELFHLQLLSALWQAFLTICGYYVTIIFAKNI